jgi:hypothetical protein
MNQPHWLYLATFADGATKVGTAAEPRKQSRLDEQGAMRATYLTTTPDGRAVRHLEDAVTRGLQIPQTVRAMTKLKALANLTDLTTATATHDHHVARVVDALADMDISVVPESGTRLLKATACASRTACGRCIRTTCARMSTASPSFRASAPKCWPSWTVTTTWTTCST